MLGEEAGEEGKQWFLCTEPSDDPKMECTKESLGIDPSSPEASDTFLCKTPKAPASHAPVTCLLVPQNKP